VYYRLGTGAKLPPLLLDDDEAVAVAVGLRAVTGVSSIEETTARALAKLEAVLPHRLKLGVNAVRDAVESGPETPPPMRPTPRLTRRFRWPSRPPFAIMKSFASFVAVTSGYKSSRIALSAGNGGGIW
jgi:hypothetical protein